MLADEIRDAIPKLLLNNEINEAIKYLIYLNDNGLATKDDKKILYRLTERR